MVELVRPPADDARAAGAARPPHRRVRRLPRRSLRESTCGADRRPRHRAGPGGGCRRPPVRERAVQHGRAAHRRGARDDGEPHHECRARTPVEPFAARRAPRRSFAAAVGGRGASALRQPGRAHDHALGSRRRRARRRSRSGAASSSSRSSAPRTATRPSSRDPDALDLRREGQQARRVRSRPALLPRCALARLETEIALATLLGRLPNLRLAIAEDDLYWRPIPIFRSLASLPVAWDVRETSRRRRATRSPSSR